MVESGNLQAAHERVIHEAVRVKPKLTMEMIDVRDARDIEGLLRKAVDNEWK
jgi:hypothetical protein